MLALSGLSTVPGRSSLCHHWLRCRPPLWTPHKPRGHVSPAVGTMETQSASPEGAITSYILVHPTSVCTGPQLLWGYSQCAWSMHTAQLAVTGRTGRLLPHEGETSHLPCVHMWVTPLPSARVIHTFLWRLQSNLLYHHQ